MDKVVRIEPLQNEPGLIGYECPSCRYVTSVFWPTSAAQRFAANLSACLAIHGLRGWNVEEADWRG